MELVSRLRGNDVELVSRLRGNDMELMGPPIFTLTAFAIASTRLQNENVATSGDGESNILFGQRLGATLHVP
jgi:hypothetical protein